MGKEKNEEMGMKKWGQGTNGTAVAKLFGFPIVTFFRVLLSIGCVTFSSVGIVL